MLAGGGYDVVVNFTGGDTFAPSLRCLKMGGRLLTCGATAGFDPKTDLRFVWTGELDVRGSNGWRRDDLAALIEMVRAAVSTRDRPRGAARERHRGASARSRSGASSERS